jgi:hypothetical protein
MLHDTVFLLLARVTCSVKLNANCKLNISTMPTHKNYKLRKHIHYNTLQISKLQILTECQLLSLSMRYSIIIIQKELQSVIRIFYITNVLLVLFRKEKLFYNSFYLSGEFSFQWIVS